MKTVVATGVTAGCGLAAIRQLISRYDGPYNVIIGSRRPESPETEAAAKALLSCRKTSKTSITYLPLDLLSFQSVENFADLVRQHLGAETGIDILLHCGGMLSTERNILTLPNGKQAEQTIVVNTLSPALLTRHLLDCLAPAARVTIVSSYMHTKAPHSKWYQNASLLTY
jgi:NAD(P)-dependent dehydrogenase (short-subunit alcohol dehydrogenase family)